MNIVEYFSNGGAFMYLIFLLDLVSISIIIVAIFISSGSDKGRFIKLTFVLVLFPLFSGLMGHYLGYIKTMYILVSVDPSQRQELYEASMAVAKYSSVFGGGSSLVLFVIWYSGLLRWKFKKPAN